MVPHLQHVDVAYRRPGDDGGELRHFGVSSQQHLALAALDEQDDARLVRCCIRHLSLRRHHRHTERPDTEPVPGQHASHWHVGVDTDIRVPAPCLCLHSKPDSPRPLQCGQTCDVVVVQVGHEHGIQIALSDTGQSRRERARRGAAIDQNGSPAVAQEDRVPLPHVEHDNLARTSDSRTGRCDRH